MEDGSSRGGAAFGILALIIIAAVAGGVVGRGARRPKRPAEERTCSPECRALTWGLIAQVDSAGTEMDAATAHAEALKRVMA